MKKAFILILFLHFVTFSATAQVEEWSRYIPFPISTVVATEPLGIHEDQDNNVLILSAKQRFHSGEKITSPSHQTSKLSPSGTALWVKYDTLTPAAGITQTTAVAALRHSSGKLMEFWNICDEKQHLGNDRLVNVNPDGTLTDGVAVAIPNVSRQMSEVIENAKGNLVGAGGSGTSKIFIYEAKPSGAMIWQNLLSLPLPVGGYVTDIAQTPDGGYALLYKVTYGSDAYPLVIKTNATGVVQWHKEYARPGQIVRYAKEMDMMMAKDGTLTIAHSSWKSQFQLLKIDPSSGQEIAFHEIAIPGEFNIEYGPHLIRQNAQGDFVLFGLFQNALSMEGGGFVAKISANGKLIWQKKYTGATQRGFTAGAILKDGTVMAAQANGRVTHVVKLKDGALTATDEGDLAGFEVEAFPNPFQSELTVRVNGLPEGNTPLYLHVFDLQGRIVRAQQSNSGIFRMEKGDMRPGVYLYRVAQNGRIVGTGKIMAE